MAEIDVWYIIINHDKPDFVPLLENLCPSDTITHLKKKIKAGDANLRDMEVWKFKSLSLDPRDKQQMDELLNNLNFTHNEESNVELVGLQTMMEELQLERFEPLLVKILPEGMQRLFLGIMFPTKLSYTLNS